AVIKSEIAKQPLQGASLVIKSLKLSAIANGEGVIVLENIPNGEYDVEVSNMGYKEIKQAFHLPLTSTDTIQFFLEIETETLDEVSVTSTRSGRSVKNTPTRVEVIAEDEVHEE